MSFSEIMTISKLPGLYQMHKQRADGLIVKSLTDEKTFFAASRAHTFTPLENITIYTATDPVELLKVFQEIKNKKIEVPSSKEDSEVLKNFFEQVVPEYDKEKVYISDIQKITKWYSILEEKNLIPDISEKKEEEGKKSEVKSEKKVVTEKNKLTPNMKSGNASSKPKAKINNTPRKTS